MKKNIIDYRINENIAKTIDDFLQKVSVIFQVRGAILFGNRARRDFTCDSDLDIAVLLSGQKKPFMDVKLEMSDMAFDVLMDTGVRVDALPIFEDEWNSPETYRNPDLLQNIKRDGIVIL